MHLMKTAFSARAIAPILSILTALPGQALVPKGRWLKELAGAEGIGFTGYPQSLGWQAEHPDSYPAAFLIVGQRPIKDTPVVGVKLIGARQSASDWVISDGSGAIWVTDLLPAPKAEEAVVLSGRFSTKEGVVFLRGIRFLLAGDPKGKTLAKSGDFVYFPLAGNKSTTCPVELEGDAVEVAFTDERDTLILRAIKPGAVKLKVFSRGFTEDKPTLTKELQLIVE